MRLPVPLPALLAVASAVVVQQSAKVSYDGYKVVRVPVGDQVEKVKDIIARLDLTTWKGVPRSGAVADIVVPPSKINSFEQEIEGMDSIIMHEDLGVSIAEEAKFEVYAAGSANSTWFNSYHSYADHLQFLYDLNAQYPSHSEIVTMGQSLDMNNITGIHLFGSAGKGIKPAIVFHGTVHAREWIATMVTEYMAYNIITNYNSSSEVKGFLDMYDFYVFPVVNPDGFMFSQTSNRLWRKNRQTTTQASCVGHDINRNWPFKWNTPGGASTDPCADDYRGASQGDAPETVVLYTYLAELQKAQGVKMYMDYHSYSQLFMIPYGYTCTAVAANSAELQSLAEGAVAAIKAVHGVSFTPGPICSTIYQASGSSVDYVHDVVGSQYTFTSELRDTGNYGFLLPAAQIQPSVEEAYAGIRYLLLNMK